MLWLIGIGGVWALCCVMTVALCVMARRGDEQIAVVFDTLPEVDFVATLAEPAVVEPAPARVQGTPV